MAQLSLKIKHKWKFQTYGYDIISSWMQKNIIKEEKSSFMTQIIH